MPRPSKRVAIAAALLLAALALRLAEVQRTAYRPVGDALAYLKFAHQIDDHGDYASPGGAAGTRGPTAYFPPGLPYFLATVRELDASIHAARLSQALLGTAIVALTGLIALDAFGLTAALTALALAALYPVLIELSGTVVAENLMTALVLAATWAALRARRAAHPYAWITAAGVLTGLATLTHQNAVVLLIPLGIAAWRIKNARGLALVLAAAALTVAPWTIRNAIELHSFVPVADETGITLVGTYNPASAANRRIPYGWRFYSTIPQEQQLAKQASKLTEWQLDAKLRSRALDYVADHPLSPLTVAYHNTPRLLELVGSFERRASAASIGLSNRAATIGAIAFWLLCLTALAGAFTTAARTAPRWLWSAPLLLALSVVLVNAETPRFREPVDPFLIVLAACALATAGARAKARRLNRAPIGAVARPPVARRDAQLVEVVERLA